MLSLTPRERALLSLDGLSIGDAFGENFFGDVDDVIPRIAEREVPETVWPYTDDTEMALSIVAILIQHGEIDQDQLASLFAQRMQPSRGYGKGAYQILAQILSGKHWRPLSRSGFNHMGSFGNGAAMRVAPLGAFFADRDLDFVAQQASLSAEITHAHPEGIAGAISVAVAAALAAQEHSSTAPLGRSFLEAVRDATPPGYTRDGLDEALALPDGTSSLQAAAKLGNGSGVTSPDTVPFCIWVAAHQAHSFENAMWATVAALGDRDTTCAIVGGILACKTGRNSIPEDWFDFREPISV